MKTIRARRAGALDNDTFAQYLETMQPPEWIDSHRSPGGRVSDLANADRPA